MNSELSPVWLALTPETKEIVKTTLLQASVAETSKAVKDKICDCIGELAGNLFTKKVNEVAEGWSNIDSFVIQASQESDPAKNYTALKIMSTLFTYMSDETSQNIETLYTIFEKALKSDQYEIRFACLEALSTLVSMSDNSNVVKTLANLCPLSLEAA